MARLARCSETRSLEDCPAGWQRPPSVSGHRRDASRAGESLATWAENRASLCFVAIFQRPQKIRLLFHSPFGERGQPVAGVGAGGASSVFHSLPNGRGDLPPGLPLLQAGGCVQGSDFAGGRQVTPLPSPRGGACGPAPISWRQGDSPSSAEAWCLGLAAPGSWRASGICPVQCHGLRVHPQGDSVRAPAVAPPGASMGLSAPRWGGSLCGLSGRLTGLLGNSEGPSHVLWALPGPETHGGGVGNV